MVVPGARTTEFSNAAQEQGHSHTSFRESLVNNHVKGLSKNVVYKIDLKADSKIVQLDLFRVAVVFLFFHPLL